MGLGAMAPVRVGVMGCASIARRRILPALMAAPQATVAAIASRDFGKALAFTQRFGGRPVHGYGALLDLDDVEAVYVPLPAALHAPWVEAALLAGKHVLAEKPLTTDAATTRELMALAAARGLVLRENVMFVHHHQHVEVERLLRAGAVGEVRSFHAAFAVPELPPGDIRYQPDMGGGALLDVGLYPVRGALRFLPGELKVAEAVLTTSAKHRVDIGGSAHLRSETGMLADLEFGLVHPYRSWYSLVGDDGRISVDQAFTPPADHQPVLRLERGERVAEIRLPSDDQVANSVASFAAAVRSGAGPDGDSLRQAMLLDEIRGNASFRPLS